MADHDHMKAAEPDWLKQANTQMYDLFATLEEVSDPTALEILDNLESRISELGSQRVQEQCENL